MTAPFRLRPRTIFDVLVRASEILGDQVQRLPPRAVHLLDVAAKAVIRFLFRQPPHLIVLGEGARLRAAIARRCGWGRTLDAVLWDAALKFRRGLVGLDYEYALHAQMVGGRPVVLVSDAHGAWAEGLEADEMRRIFRPVLRALAANAPRKFFESTVTGGKTGAALYGSLTPRQTSLFLHLPGVSVGWQRSVDQGGDALIEREAHFKPHVEVSAHDRIALVRDVMPVLHRVPRLAAALRLGLEPRSVIATEAGGVRAMTFYPTTDVMGAVLAAIRGENGQTARAKERTT